MAMTKGYAINLSGGYHHASRKSGEGFCVYADITLAIQEVKKFANVTKTMIIDLDAHYWVSDMRVRESVVVLSELFHDISTWEVM